MPALAQAPSKVVNRLRAVLLHVPYYCIESLARLAEDSGLSKATLSRLNNHKRSPSYRVAEAIAEAISKRSGIRLISQEIFSNDGTYPTVSTCELMGCSGCLPPQAWDESTDRLKPEWRHQKPGKWSRREADPTSPGHLI